MENNKMFWKLFCFYFRVCEMEIKNI